MVSYDSAAGVLTVETVNGVLLTLAVSADTEIDVDDDCVAEASQGDNSGSGSEEPTLADLVPGTPVGEFEIDYDDEVIEEIKIDC